MELVEKDRSNVFWSLALAEALSAPIGVDPARRDEGRRQALAIVADLRERGVFPQDWRDHAPALSRIVADGDAP